MVGVLEAVSKVCLATLSQTSFLEDGLVGDSLSHVSELVWKAPGERFKTTPLRSSGQADEGDSECDQVNNDCVFGLGFLLDFPWVRQYAPENRRCLGGCSCRTGKSC